MANIKFSGFTEVTSISAVQEIVGYNGTQNVRITPANFVTSAGTGVFLPLAGGTMSGVAGVVFPDSFKLNLGIGSDLQISHDAFDSYINNLTGHLYIRQLADDKDISFGADDGAGGIETYFFLDGSAGGPSPFTVFPDSSTLTFGTGYDLRQYHNGADSYLDNYGGNLNLRNLANDKDIIFQSDDGAGGTAEYFRLDGVNQRNIFSKNIGLGDNVLALFGNGNDMQIFHGDNQSQILNLTGNLRIRNFADDSDIMLESDDGAGATTPYLTLHGSTTNAYFTNPGNVGIGTTSPGYKLEVESSTTPLHLNRTGGATALIGLDINGTTRGWLGATTTAAFVSYSTATAALVTVANTGGVQFNTYGAGTFTGTLAKTLGVTSAGDVIEYVPPVSVVGNNSIYVAPVGTLAENGAALLAGYTAAVTKIGSDSQPGGFLALGFPAFAPGAVGNTNWLGIANTAILFAPGPVYQAPWGSPSGTQVLIQVTSVGGFGASSFEFTITNLDGSPFTATGTSFSEPNLSVPVPSCLIIAPGSYEIASDLVINELVSVTSLTGQPDVIITGGNVQVRAGANDVAYRISITGLYTKMSIFTESSLNYITFKNCIGQGTNSFSFDPAAGDGINSGSYIECVGGEKSFGGGIGNVAAGVYTRCVAAGEWGFGGLAKTTGAFMNCGSQDPGFFIFPIDPNAAPASKPAKMFGGQGTRIGGFFDGCIGGYGAFGFQNTIDITARFTNCSGGNESFGCRSTGNSGQYYNCTVGTIGGGGRQGFGCNPQGGDTATGAYYYNCSADVIASNADIGSKFMNCHATPNTSNIFSSNWSNYNCSDNGIAYNCSFGSGNTSATQPTVSGTGKIRNCLAGGSNQFTIVNLG